MKIFSTRESIRTGVGSVNHWLYIYTSQSAVLEQPAKGEMRVPVEGCHAHTLAGPAADQVQQALLQGR